MVRLSKKAVRIFWDLKPKKYLKDELCTSRKKSGKEFLYQIYFLNVKLLPQEGEKMYNNLICKSEDKNLIQKLKLS